MLLKKAFLFILVLCPLLGTESQRDDSFVDLFQGCRKQLSEWVGFKQSIQQLISKCSFANQQQKMLQLYKQLTEIDLTFSNKHFDLIRKYLKQDAQLKQSLNCLIEARNTQNEFFKQPKKFKYFGKFIRQQPNQGKLLFVQQQNMWKQKGKKLCNYFKAFFQHYYLQVLRPSETLSTTFIRALTVRTDIFNHEDIAYCVDLDTHGNLVQSLDSLDINNIYVKIPQVFNAIRFIKFKKQCKSDQYSAMAKKIQQKLKKIDMFKVMYHDYEPFVQVAAEKFGTTQIKLLARKFSHIFDNIQEYEKYATQEL